MLLSALLVVSASACGEKAETAKATPRQDALSRGLKAHGEGKFEVARKAYLDALKADRHNKFAYFNLGLLEQSADRPAAAEANYRLALEEDPDYTPALYNLATVREAAKDSAEAVPLYRRVIKLDPKHAGAHLNLGLLLREAGKDEEADRLIARAVELDPTLESRARTSPTPSPR